MENKPECIIDDFGNKYWFNKSDQYHNEYGPAIIWKNGDTEWRINSKLHRLDGPAKVFVNEKHLNEWWINDYRLTNTITKWAEENDIDLDNLTREDKALIKLVWADYSGIIK